MKLFFLIVLTVLLTRCEAYAQNTPWSASGSIGIGTTSPGGKLTVRSGINSLPLTSGSVQTGSALRVEGGDNAVIDFGTNSINTWIQATDKLGLGLNYMLNLNPNGGNVGIGILSPKGKLDINGGILLLGATNNVMPRPVVGSTRIAGEIAAYSKDNFTQDDGFLRLSAGGGTNLNRTFIDLSGYSTIPDMDRNIVFGTVGAERVRINSFGYVGIGTPNPDAILAVNGTIHSKEVKVDLTHWPDYVFESAYRLPALAEIKNYVDLYHRLPEIPSEQDIIKNGLNLGEMNKLLMKKVEELTLYLIQQEEEIKQLKIEVKKIGLK